MFKTVIGRGHPEFSTNRQQDAQEFFMHLLSAIDRAEVHFTFFTLIVDFHRLLLITNYNVHMYCIYTDLVNQGNLRVRLRTSPGNEEGKFLPVGFFFPSEWLRRWNNSFVNQSQRLLSPLCNCKCEGFNMIYISS